MALNANIPKMQNCLFMRSCFFFSFCNHYLPILGYDVIFRATDDQESK